MELYSKIETINDKDVKIKIWDTAGQEQFRSLTRNFFHNTEGVFLIYDVTNMNSFEQVKTWMGCIHDNAAENVKVVLIASKIDLENERVVSPEDGKNLSKYLKIDYFETSALKNINIREAVLDLSKQVLTTKKEIEEAIKLKQSEEVEEVKQGCKC
jgi:small GTP-binding protein